VAAFQFDPDATPEEKAAQARAVSWHHLMALDSILISVLSASLRDFTTHPNQNP